MHRWCAVRLLPNLSKRLTKRPKVYLRDTGLLHFFLGIQTRDRLDVSPSCGTSWESLVIAHVVSAFEREAPGARAFFFRTATGVEVDLVIQRGRDVFPFEIKAHTSPGRDHLEGLVSFLRDLRARRGYAIARSAEDYSLREGPFGSSWRIRQGSARYSRPPARIERRLTRSCGGIMMPSCEPP